MLQLTYNTQTVKKSARFVTNVRLIILTKYFTEIVSKYILIRYLHILYCTVFDPFTITIDFHKLLSKKYPVSVELTFTYIFTCPHTFPHAKGPIPLYHVLERIRLLACEDGS